MLSLARESSAGAAVSGDKYAITKSDKVSASSTGL